MSGEYAREISLTPLGNPDAYDTCEIYHFPPKYSGHVKETLARLDGRASAISATLARLIWRLEPSLRGALVASLSYMEQEGQYVGYLYWPGG